MQKFHGNNKYFDIDIKPELKNEAAANSQQQQQGSKQTDTTLTNNNDKFESLTFVADPSDSDSTRLYKRRWLILTLYSLTLLTNVFHLTFYDDLQNSLNTFYYNNFDRGITDNSKLANPSPLTINWISLIHLTYNVIFIFPAMFLLEHKGLRTCFLTGSVLTALGSWIKCNSIRSSSFPILLLGQIICGIGFCFVKACLVKLAALWFGKSELGTTISVINDFTLIKI
jgi:hypothetical protein